MLMMVILIAAPTMIHLMILMVQLMQLKAKQAAAQLMQLKAKQTAARVYRHRHHGGVLVMKEMMMIQELLILDAICLGAPAPRRSESSCDGSCLRQLGTSASRRNRRRHLEHRFHR